MGMAAGRQHHVLLSIWEHLLLTLTQQFVTCARFPHAALRALGNIVLLVILNFSLRCCGNGRCL